MKNSHCVLSRWCNPLLRCTSDGNSKILIFAKGRRKADAHLEYSGLQAQDI